MIRRKLQCAYLFVRLSVCWCINMNLMTQSQLSCWVWKNVNIDILHDIISGDWIILCNQIPFLSILLSHALSARQRDHLFVNEIHVLLNIFTIFVWPTKDKIIENIIYQSQFTEPYILRSLDEALFGYYDLCGHSRIRRLSQHFREVFVATRVVNLVNQWIEPVYIHN